MDPILDEAWYEPLESVPGHACTPIPPADESVRFRLAPALEKAVAYAEAHDSCGLMVLHRGLIVLERYWCQLEAESHFNPMSMSKTVVALAVGAAIAQGLIGSVQDRVDKYLPEWRDDERGAITIEQLLQMRSGLRNGNMIRVHIGTQARLDALATPLTEKPGSAFRYNNINTLILTMILEQVSGSRYADFLSTRIWQPIGAGDASVWLDREGGLAKTYCCLMASVRDWARVGLLLLHRGRVGETQVVPDSWVAQMLAPSPTEENYGYHIWLGYSRPPSRYADWSVPFTAPDVAMVTGQEEQRVFVIPSQDLVIVRVGHDSSDWDDTVLPNLIGGALTQGPALAFDRSPAEPEAP